MDLTTDYLGLRLRNPLVAAASPLSSTVAGVQRLADAGIGAVVLPSLFEEQLRAEDERDARLADLGTDSFPESLTYLPPTAGLEGGLRRYLSLLSRAVAAVDVPVIASLNGVTAAGGPTTRPRCRTPARPRSNSTSITCPATRASPATRSSNATSTSSPESGPS